MTDVHVNTRRTLTDLGMRDTARHLFYACATWVRRVVVPAAAPPNVVAPRVGFVEALFAFGFPLPVPVGQKWGLPVRRMSVCSRAVPASPTRYATGQGRGRLAA